MKICAAQVRPFTGNIEKNIERHAELAHDASVAGADLVFFPELSLTGYEPGLAGGLALPYDAEKLDSLQQMSDTDNIIICAGLPLKGTDGILISMAVFMPGQPRQCYSKQYLHEDEKPYFIPGNKQICLEAGGRKIAPAICYESLLTAHSDHAVLCGADVYLASVAKHSQGVAKAFAHYPEIARRHAMPVLMANGIGLCDNFESAGCTAVWDSRGELCGQLGESDEGLLIFDTVTEEAVIC